MARSREAGWIPTPERGTFEEHVRLGACSVSIPHWACSSRYPPTRLQCLVHVRCRPCLPDYTSVHVYLPVTLWGTRESGTESLLSSYPSRTSLTHVQTLKRREFQLHSRREQWNLSINLIRPYLLKTRWDMSEVT